MNIQNRIELYRAKGFWHMKLVGPGEGAACALLGSSVLPTPYPDSVSAVEVVEVVRRIYAGDQITVINDRT